MAHDVPDSVQIVGVPARIVKDLNNVSLKYSREKNHFKWYVIIGDIQIDYESSLCPNITAGVLTNS